MTRSLARSQDHIVDHKKLQEEFRNIKQGRIVETRMCKFGAECRYKNKCKFRHPQEERGPDRTKNLAHFFGDAGDPVPEPPKEEEVVAAVSLGLRQVREAAAAKKRKGAPLPEVPLFTPDGEPIVDPDAPMASHEPAKPAVAPAPVVPAEPAPTAAPAAKRARVIGVSEKPTDSVDSAAAVADPVAPASTEVAAEKMPAAEKPKAP
jgi:hypothetical protein